MLKGLNYDGNIVQFYGICMREADAQPMLVTELMEGALLSPHGALLSDHTATDSEPAPARTL